MELLTNQVKQCFKSLIFLIKDLYSERWVILSCKSRLTVNGRGEESINLGKGENPVRYGRSKKLEGVT